MKMKLTAAIRELRTQPKRTLLVVFALFIGIWGAGTVLVSYYILTHDLDANFQSTVPSHLTLESDDFHRLDLAAFLDRPDVETAEFRDFSFLRIEIHPDVWVPLWLYGVEDFEEMRLAKVFPQAAAFQPTPGSILIERNGQLISNISTGSRPRIRVGGQTKSVAVSGICFDPAQAPATQDRMIFAYTDQATFTDITGKPSHSRLIVRLNGVQSAAEVESVSKEMVADLREAGIRVTEVKLPKFNAHPHQWQLNTILFVIGTIGLLAFLMGCVLVSQLMQSILARQVRRIGIMKAIGGSRYQVIRIYVYMLLLPGALAGAVAVPLAVLAGSAYANFVAGILNFDILTSVPVSIYVFLSLLSILLPLALSLFILFRGTSVSVQKAISDYGTQSIAGQGRLSFVQKLRFPFSLRLAIANSMRNYRRLAATIATMALGVAIFNTGFNVRQSLWNLLHDLETELNYDVQVVLGEQIPRAEALAPFASLDNVKEVGFWNGGSGAIQSQLLSSTQGIGIVALPYDTDLIRPHLIEGRWLSGGAELEMVVNQQAWEVTGNVAVGSQVELTIGKQTISPRLVGIVEQFDLAKLYIDAHQYDSLFNPQHLVNTVSFVAEDNSYHRVIQLKKEIEHRIEASQLDVMYVSSDVERVQVIFEHLDIILSVIVFLSFLVLLVSAVGMASATSIGIVERMREIGVLRAIGATPRKVYALFVAEGMVVSVLSIVLGMLLSYPLSQLASRFFGNLMLGEQAVLRYAFSPAGLVVTLGVTLVFGWLASRVPARGAVRMVTREALGYG